MQRSGPGSAIITGLVGLVLTPVGIGLISIGGGFWYRVHMTTFGRPIPDPRPLVAPTVQIVIGLMLLAAVIVSSRWNPAGLLVAGVLGVGSLIFCLVPVAFREYILLFSHALPIQWFDGLYYGLMQVIGVGMGAMGLARLTDRRPTTISSGQRVAAVIVALVAIPLGVLVSAHGVGLTLTRAMLTMRFRFDAGGIAVLVIGIALLIVGVLASRWSPFALIAPSAILVAIGAMVLTPRLQFLPNEVVRTATPFFGIGGGLAMAVTLLVFMAVLLLTKRGNAQTAAPGPRPAIYTFPAAPGR